MKIYEVGGCVRDRLLGNEPKDIDYVVVGSTQNEMLSLGYQQVGKDFPVFLKDGSEYALARIERKTGNGYNGFTVESDGVTLEEDLFRRDLTINAMAMDSKGNVYDPYNGKQDLENKVIRHVSTHFAEDPLRILRAIRFSSQLNFEIEDDTFNAIVEFVPWLKNISRERIRDEFNKILVTNNFSKGINYLKVSGILSYLIPEISKFDSVQNETSQYHTKNLFNHTFIFKTINNPFATQLNKLTRIFNSFF